MEQSHSEWFEVNRSYLATVTGEIVLKSRRSRPRFYKRLLTSIADALKRSRVQDFKLEVEGTKIKVVVEGASDALSALRRVFGVYRVGEVEEIRFSGLKDLSEKVSIIAKDLVIGKRFAVRVHRVGKHDFTSLQAEREIGSALYPFSKGVDLENPEVVVWVEIRDDKAYVYRERVEGPGGLPIGVEGRVLALYSGGFDSPVASWYIGRRGAEVHFLHYFLGSSTASYLAVKSMKDLSFKWFHGYRPRAYIVDFSDVIRSITASVKNPYRQVVLKVLMYSSALEIAKRYGYDAIVTGEVLGQASSQTLHNLKAIESVVHPHIPIFRPLIGMDKEDIIRLARDLGTYEDSSKVGEPCAIARGWVATKAKVKELMDELRKVDMDVLKEAVDKVKVIDLLSIEPSKALPGDNVEIDFLPEDAVLVDLRSRSEWMRDRIPGSIHVDDVRDWGEFAGRTLVLYCKEGSKSYVLAKELRSKGLTAFSFKGGVKALKKFLSDKG